MSSSIMMNDAIIICCRELNKRLVEEQAKKIYERSMRQEQDFGEFFTG